MLRVSWRRSVRMASSRIVMMVDENYRSCHNFVSMPSQVLNIDVKPPRSQAIVPDI